MKVYADILENYGMDWENGMTKGLENKIDVFVEEAIHFKFFGYLSAYDKRKLAESILYNFFSIDESPIKIVEWDKFVKINEMDERPMELIEYFHRECRYGYGKYLKSLNLKKRYDKNLKPLEIEKNECRQAKELMRKLYDELSEEEQLRVVFDESMKEEMLMSKLMNLFLTPLTGVFTAFREEIIKENIAFIEKKIQKI